MSTSAKDIKQISLGTLENSNSSSVWVLNVTNPAGHINLTVSDGMGKAIGVRAVKTWIPIDLTTQATKQSILSSPQFRSLLAKKAMRLLDADECVKFMENKDAAEEHARIYSLGEIAAVGEDPSNNPQLAARRNEAEGNLNPFAMNIAVNRDMDEDSIIRELRNREDELASADWQFIAQESMHEKVKSFAAERAK